MKKIILVLALSTATLTANLVLYAQEKSLSREESARPSQTSSIIDQLREWAKALGIAWGGPTM